MTESSTIERRVRTKRIGVVTSDKGDKSIRVTYRYSVKHRKYGKYIRRQTTLHAHDENNVAKLGNLVEVMACRPVSKTKCWRLTRVLQG